MAAASLPLRAEMPQWPDYRLGQAAERDIYSAARFQLIDPDATEHRRQQEARRVPLLFHQDLDADLQCQAMLRAALRQTRLEFQDALEAVYARRTLTAEETRKQVFRKLLARFRGEHKNFPMPIDLASAWARGLPDDPWLSTWTEHLKHGMTRRIRPNALPKGWPWPPTGVRLFPLSHGEAVPPLKTALEVSTRLRKTNLVSLSSARRDFRASFSESDKGLGRVLSQFLTNNCSFSADLTRRARSEKRAAILVIDQYKIGQRIVRKGQIIDEKVWRALRELKLQLGRGEWASPAPSVTLPADSPTSFSEIAQPASSAPDEITPAVAPEPARALPLRITGLSLSVLGLLALWVGWKRRQQRVARALPAPRSTKLLPGAQAECPSCQSPLLASPEGQRFLDPRSARRGLFTDPVRATVAAQITGWLKGRFVRALMGERAVLHRQQENAERDIRDIAQRLAKAHAPLKERLRTYEARIAELERELAEKGEVNRELIQAQIEAARKQMKVEQGHDTSVWN